MEIAEKSENHLKAIVGRRQMAEGDGVWASAEISARKAWGEGKALKIGSRGWQPWVASAEYIDLRGIVNVWSVPGLCDGDADGQLHRSFVGSPAKPRTPLPQDDRS